MQTLNTTIVNTDLPSMAHSLNESPLRMHSVIVSYVLTIAVMLPASGWLADRFGVKKVFSAPLYCSPWARCCMRAPPACKSCRCPGSCKGLAAR